MQIGYDKLTAALNRRLPAERLEVLGRATSFIRRLRQVSASGFVWSVVLSRFGQGVPGFEQARQWFKRLTGIEVWPRPFQMRFKAEQAVELLRASFEEAVKPWRSAARRLPQHALSQCFPDIVAIDSTPVALHDELRPYFKGLRAAASQIKVVLGISVFGLVPLCARLVSNHRPDRSIALELELFRKGTLLLFDQAFGVYDRLRSMDQAQLKYLGRARRDTDALVVGINFAPKRVRKALERHPAGRRIRTLLHKDGRIRKPWDLQVQLRPTGKGHDRSPFVARLIIVPGPGGEQRRYLTNLGPNWTPAAVAELYRLRWQIELVFKELKQHLNLEAVPTKDPDAAQVFVWASLLALAVSRTVASWLTPLSQLVGLAAKLRPAVLSRALRASSHLLARLLVAPANLARELAALLAEQLWQEAHQRARARDDSFKRLIPLLPQDAAA